MSGRTNKLFVYGTLLQGEPMSYMLNDCKMVEALEVPGALYHTAMGYPVAEFKNRCGWRVAGELYEIPEIKERDKIKELDMMEVTEEGLFRRKEFLFKGHRFHAYEAGSKLRGFTVSKNRIRTGSWRLHGSTAKNDPVNFAVRFEKYLSNYYREFRAEDSKDCVHLRGELPILVSAPHASAHIRMNRLKSEEKYTGSLSAILHSLTGCHALFTYWASKTDPNFYDDASFKNTLEHIVKSFGIRLVIDIHGTSAKKDYDLYPGLGTDNQFLMGKKVLLEQLIRSAETYGIRLGGLNVFPASRQMTVTKFVVTKLRIPGIQIEINKRLRAPEHSTTNFKNLLGTLANFIDSAKHLHF